MALFLRPANVQKNVAATFQLNLEELAALEIVPAGYYKDQSNWKKIVVRVGHKNSDQKTLINYPTGSNVGTLLVSDTARAGAWEIESIVIEDFDRGEIVIKKEQIPNGSDFDFYVVSAATHGDLIVNNGEVVELPANGTRQYGDVIVEAGGIVKLADGGGILEIEALNNCIINGTILANNGKHMGGTWSKTSVLGETLSHTVVQPQGGKGGDGENLEGTVVAENLMATTYGVPMMSTITQLIFDEAYPALATGRTFTVTSGMASTTFFTLENKVNDTTYDVSPVTGTVGAVVGGTIEYSGFTAGGIGGDAAYGNGGAGGRAAKFIPMAGGSAIDVHAGQGVAQAVVADEVGENGIDSTAPVNTAGGGFRGAHGQCVYIKAPRIQGSGVINASGQNGGNGGAGGEYLADGELFANGPGGGGAGGCGGKVWLRAKKGTPVLTVNVQAGERGARGLASPGASEAQHGQAGTPGAYDFSLF